MAYNIWNTLKQSPATYIPKAASNIYGRLKSTPQYTAGAGGIPTWDNLKRALTPQTAYAADGTETAYRPKGDGGWDFFVNSQPASYQDYMNSGGTTQPPATITGGETNTWTPKSYNNVIYDTPEAYKAAVDEDIMTQHAETTAKIEKMWKAGLITLEDKETAIAKNRADLIVSRDAALADQKGFFSSVSPQALQSQEGVYAGKVNTDYANNAAQIGPEVSGKFGSMTPEQIAQYANAPGMGQVGNLARGYQDLATQRADLTATEGRNLNSNLDASTNMLINAKSDMASLGAGATDYKIGRAHV